jgi:YVTN family beta-propeller protein
MSGFGHRSAPSRRDVICGAAATTAFASTLYSGTVRAQSDGPVAGDRVFLCNEDSNTLSVIDPVTNAVAGTVNLTSFDEDPRPPFRFVTGGIVPAHGAMIQKPLYHGAISIHGAVPSPDSRLIATTGRGTSNVYLVDTAGMKVVGNSKNPASGDVNPERITSGVFVGREPHEPTFTRNGRELWVTVRGEDRIAVLDVAKMREESEGRAPRGAALRGLTPTIEGPAQVWFAKDGKTAFVISQKTAKVDILSVAYDAAGFSQATRKTTVDISAQDKFGFSPFLKLSPDGREIWMTHKLADAVSVIDAAGEPRVVETIPLGAMARPNHVEFVENARGKAVYASLARVDDGGPGGVASSRIAIIDRSSSAGSRKVVGTFFSGAREAHGLWTDPFGTRLYIAHEQDELPGTPNAGQTVCTAFDVSDPFAPKMLSQIALGELSLPSGKLRNKKSINLVYVRPGAISATG